VQGSLRHEGDEGNKTPLFEPFVYKIDEFTKTGPETNIGKALKNDRFFAALDPEW
jgi:hypothetical protein